MSDYHFHISVLRDAVAEQLVDGIENTPHVLAEMAADIQPGTVNFDDFMDCAQGLDDEQKATLAAFCERVAFCLSPT